MAGARQSETYRATVATAFGVQELCLRVTWRRQRHLTVITLELSSDVATHGDITAVVALVPCSVVTADNSVLRSGHGGAALMIALGPDDRTGRVRSKAIVANVGPNRSPVAGVQIEGRNVPLPRRWSRAAAAAIATGAAAMIIAVGAGVIVSDVIGHGSDVPAALAGEPTEVTTERTAAGPSSTVATPLTGAPVTVTAPAPAPDRGANQDAAGLDQRLLDRVTAEYTNWLVIPRIDLVSPIVRGVDDHDLGRGVGRYTTTARIGGAGNLGLAGHRTTAPAPFRHLDQMQVGDPVFVVTPAEVLRYDVEQAAPGLPHIEVRPEEVSVLDGRGHDGLTLTTCTPVGTTERRLIVFARLVERGPRVGATPG